MKKTDISKSELLKQRKERKRRKKAEKRKKKIIRFTVKLSALFFVVILLYVGVFSWVLRDNPYCDESNTYEYTAKCTDIIEVERYTTRSGHSYIWHLHFENGEIIPINKNTFDRADKNDLIGENITFRMYEKDGSDGRIIAEIRDENGNEYLAFEEYNKDVKDIRTMAAVIGAVAFLIVCISAVSLWYDS